MAIDNFNKIISVEFFTGNVRRKSIICPKHGRKPTIELNGSYVTSATLNAFNLTFKNFILDFSEGAYNRIRVTAGYENKTVTFDGQVVSIYQDTPGPDGNTIVQCQLGNLLNAVSKYISVDYETGTPVRQIIQDISSKLELETPRLDLKTETLFIKDRIQFDGLATVLLAKLADLFQEENLIIKTDYSYIVAFCAGGGSSYGYAIRLKYLSSIPANKFGDDTGSYTTSFNAPWEPGLKVGDLVTIPAWQYTRAFSVVNTGVQQNTYKVTSIAFHFSTTEAINTMTVEGYKV